VVIVVAGAVLVAILVAVTDAEWGAIAAAVLLGVGLGALWMRSRGSLPEGVEVAPGDRGTHRILVVANRTIEGRELLAEITARTEGRRSELLLVCPALAGTRLQHLASDIDDARAEAERRLERSLAALREAGLDARGVVGDDDPFAAAADALATFGADEVIISTLPPASSRWLELGVVERLRNEVPIPVTHVVVDAAVAGREERSAAA
jgi:GABA permease